LDNFVQGNVRSKGFIRQLMCWPIWQQADSLRTDIVHISGDKAGYKAVDDHPLVVAQSATYAIGVPLLATDHHEDFHLVAVHAR
jgi:hypothetical protein